LLTSVPGHSLKIPNLKNILKKIKCYKFQCTDYIDFRKNLLLNVLKEYWEHSLTFPFQMIQCPKLLTLVIISPYLSTNWLNHLILLQHQPITNFLHHTFFLRIYNIEHFHHFSIISVIICFQQNVTCNIHNSLQWFGHWTAEYSITLEYEDTNFLWNYNKNCRTISIAFFF